MTGEETPQAARPILRVMSGNPTPEELAAIVTVVAVAASSAAETGEPTQAASGWGAPTAMHRQPMPAPGPGAWAQLGRR